jgi:hypothetical protein
VALAFKASHSVGNGTDPLSRANRRTTVFLNDKRHNSRGVYPKGAYLTRLERL